jgi:Rrf2 family nitric oxide-sensitive transcriptional repressor
MKIANKLAHAGLIEAVRGRGGGIRLGRAAEDINLAEIVALTEPRCAMVDCGSCRLTRRCRLPAVLDRAAAAFRAVLGTSSLADIIGAPPARQPARPDGTSLVPERELELTLAE